jgi:hypothetical protein
MPNGKEKDEAKEKFENILKDFIKEANKNGIKVDAEAGWQNWAEPGNSYKANVVLDYVINFNKRNREKFRGFQYDVEVYLLPKYFFCSESFFSVTASNSKPLANRGMLAI